MQYKGDKDVNDAARSLEGGPAEAGGLSASSLPWFEPLYPPSYGLNIITAVHLQGQFGH